MSKDKYFSLLIIIGLLFSIFTIFMVSKVKYLGNSEDAGYVLIGKSISEGIGLTSRTVLFYFDRYAQVTHPDDTAPPLYPIILAVLFRFFGINVVLAKSIPILFSCLLLPVFIYLLARKITNSNIAFLSALIVMFSPISYANSTHTEVEAMFASFVVLALYMFIKGMEKPIFYLWMGGFCGLAFLTKYTGIVLFASLIISYILLYFLKKVKFTNYFIFGILIGMVVISPLLVRNYVLFGKPMYSVNEKVGVLNDNFISKTFYWDEKLPSFIEYFLTKGMWDFELLAMRTIRMGIILLPLHLCALFGFYFLGTKKIIPLIVYYLIFCLFHIIAVAAFYDYFISIISLAIIPSVYFLVTIVPKGLKLNKKYFEKAAYFFIFILFVFTASKFFINVNIQNLRIGERGFPFADTIATDSIMNAGIWAKENLAPDNIVMVKKPRGFTFYSDLPSIYLVPDSMEKVFEIAKYYKANYIQCDALDREEFSLIYKNERFSLCTINWDKVK
ncbi:MAG: glycosyltransferase family 39 protein [archaeon]